MKNADMPAIPLCTGTESGTYNGQTYTKYFIDSEGLTKREVIAKDIDIGEFKFNSIDDMAEFIGRGVNQQSMEDLIKASAECDAKIRAIYADALLKELEK